MADDVRITFEAVDQMSAVIDRIQEGLKSVAAVAASSGGEMSSEVGKSMNEVSDSAGKAGKSIEKSINDGLASVEKEVKSLSSLFAQALTDPVGAAKELGSTLADMLGPVGVAGGIAAAAIGGIGAAIVAIGSKGSSMNQIQDGFNQLAGGAEKAKGMLEALDEGTDRTISKTQLMSYANRMLGSGAVKTAEQFGTLGKAADLLADRYGEDTMGVLESFNAAMLRGNDRALKMKGVTIDLEKSTKEYADSLRLTVQQLTPEQTLQAKRIGILQALQKEVDKAGEKELTFGERIEQVQRSIGSWTGTMAKAVAASPAVNDALKRILDAWNKTFGSDSKSLADAFVGVIEKLATSIAAIVEVVMGFVRVWQGLPEPLKQGIEVIGTMTLAVWALNAAFTSTAAVGIAKFVMGIPGMIAGMVSGTAAAGTMGAVLFAAASPAMVLAAALAAVGAAAAVAYQAYKLWSETADRDAADKRQAATDTENLAKINQKFGTSFTDIATASEYARKKSEELRVASTGQTDAQRAAAAAAKEQAAALDGQLSPAEERAKAFAAEFTKALESLQARLRGGPDEVAVLTAAFNGLSPAMKQNADVQKILVSEIEKLVSAHKTLPPALKAYYEATKEAQRAELEAGVEKLRHVGITEQMIVAEIAAGKSETELAIKYGVSTEALAKYRQEMGLAKQAQDDMEASRKAARAAMESGPGASNEELLRRKLRDLAEESAKAMLEIDKKYASDSALATQVKAEKIKEIEARKNQAIQESDRATFNAYFEEQQKEIAAAQQKADMLTAYNEEGVARRQQLADREFAATMARIDKEEKNGSLTAEADRRRAVELYDAKTKLAQNSYDTIDVRAKQAGYTSKAVLEEQARDAKTMYEQMKAKGGYTYEELKKAEQAWIDLDKQARGDMSVGWSEALDGLVSSFEQLANIAGGSFGGIVKGIGEVMGALKLGQGAAKGLGNILMTTNADGSKGFNKSAFEAKNLGGTIAGIAGNAMGMVSSLMQATETGSKGMKALKGAASGASMGFSIAGPWGAAIGGVAGAITGLVRGTPEWQKSSKDLGRSLGMNISEELAKAIVDQSKKLNINRNIAEALNISKAIEQAGGLTAETFQKTLARSVELFDIAKRGGEVGKLALEEQNKLIGMFGEYSVQNGNKFDKYFVDVMKRAIIEGKGMEGVNKTLAMSMAKVAENGELASAELLELIKMTEDAGTASKELLATQAGFASKALGGLSEYFAGASAAEAKLKELEDQAKSASGDALVAINKQIVAQKNLVSALSVTQTSAAGMGAAVAASFSKIVASGAPMSEVVKQISPLLKEAQKQFEKAGVGGGEAFDRIRAMADLAADEVAGPALDAMHGLGSALRDLHNGGMLNQEMFSGLTGQITSTFNALVAQGKSADQIFPLMQKDLQTVWELQDKFGYAVDEATQKLIDQAVESGTVGAAHKSASDQMVDGINKVVDRMDLLLTKMGVALPAAADGAARAAVNAANNMGGAMERVGGAVGGVAGKLDGTPWSDWAYEGIQAAEAVQDAVDGVSFGSSPGGIKEIPLKLMESIKAAKSWSGVFEDEMGKAKAAVEDVYASDMGLPPGLESAAVMPPGTETNQLIKQSMAQQDQMNLDRLAVEPAGQPVSIVVQSWDSEDVARRGVPQIIQALKGNAFHQTGKFKDALGIA